MSDETTDAAKRPAPGELLLVAPRRQKAPAHLADLDPAQRRAAVADLGFPAYRADQISRHYFGHLAPSAESWTDIPKADRAALAHLLTPELLRPVREITCDEGQTRKTLWRLFDGALVEGVLMRYARRGQHDLGADDDDETEPRHDRVTVCVSSQVGCGMNCPFCATGQGGLTRNMSTAEIVEQVVAAARGLPPAEPGQTGSGISNVVFMGMGEPMANYDAVIAAVRRLVAPVPDGLGISARGITVSTVGLVPRMRALADEGLPVTLALSLHAPDDELRRELVPVNTRWDIDEVLDAAWHYADVTKRRVTIEYALIRDINDQVWRADLLAKRLQGHLVHVNLIPLNPTPGSKWTASRRKDEQEFVRRLVHGGVAVTVRDTRGREIDGACGQLAGGAR